MSKTMHSEAMYLVDAGEPWLAVERMGVSIDEYIESLIAGYEADGDAQDLIDTYGADWREMLAQAIRELCV